MRAVVFDLGGVVLDWDPDHLYQSLIPDEQRRRTFLTEVCSWAWHSQHDAGRPMAETIPELCARHPEHTELIEAWSSRYVEMVSGEVDGMAALLTRVREHVPTYALTNMPAEVMAPLRAAYPLLDLFDGAVVSGDERVVKPHRAIFEILVDRFDLVPSETLFVDDLQRNVAGATAAGLRAVRFTTADALEAVLESAGVFDQRR